MKNLYVNLLMEATLAQLVEQGTENPCVLGSIPRRGTILKDNNDKAFSLVFLFVKISCFIKFLLFSC